MGLHPNQIQKRCVVSMYPSGKMVDIFNLQPEDIEIEDIAHHLARICRWGGGVPGFYSVAEHSVAVAGRCMPSNRLAALLHDAAEAYTGDLKTPLKNRLFNSVDAGVYTHRIESLEANILAVVLAKFGINEELPMEINIADKTQLKHEEKLIKQGTSFGNMPNIAKARFMAAFNNLMEEVEVYK